MAKGTLIRIEGRQDIDIFVVFDSDGGISKLESSLKKLKLPGKLKVVHGSRDYFQIENDEFIIEVIPVVKNFNPELAENVTDVSLSHVKYICEEIKKNPTIADEIRLAKAFCRAQRCYGAESYIRGFSGYSLEILVIYFGSFVKFLKGILKSRVIDSARHFKNEREILREINSSKLNSPVILVDPTYKYRNVTAGLGLETFETFLGVVNKFLKSPSLEFFELKKIDVDNLKDFASQNGARFIEIDLVTDRQEGDVAGTKMKKFFDFFCSELSRKKQDVLRKEFDYSGSGQKAKGYLVVEENNRVEIRGPSIKLVDAVENFKKANSSKDIFESGGYFWVREKISIGDIFEKVKKVEGEIGAGGKIVSG